MGHNMSIEPDVCAWLQSRLGHHGIGTQLGAQLGAQLDAQLGAPPSGAAGAVLHVRRPAEGVRWTQPPPGAASANENTVLETFNDAAAQGEVLDSLLGAEGGLPLARSSP